MAKRQQETQKSLTVTSNAFQNGTQIPREFTCQGTDVSPPLSWGKGPDGTRSFAVVVDDPDAPGGTWTHWTVWNIPNATTQFAKGQDPKALGAREGQTTWTDREPGYGGPCPPTGSHRYFFRVYALDTTLDLANGARAADLTRAMEGHVLGWGEIMGTYQKT